MTSQTRQFLKYSPPLNVCLKDLRSADFTLLTMCTRFIAVNSTPCLGYMVLVHLILRHASATWSLFTLFFAMPRLHGTCSTYSTPCLGYFWSMLFTPRAIRVFGLCSAWACTVREQMHCELFTIYFQYQKNILYMLHEWGSDSWSVLLTCKSVRWSSVGSSYRALIRVL